jgi:hypothetical protein
MSWRTASEITLLRMHRTKTDASMAEAELAHTDDPERAELLRRARRFKASWIELAEALTQAKRGGRWREWGYETFEAYAKAELHLRQETVDKLTGSYTFLQKRAPAVLERDPLREPMPSYQSVDFLRRAEASEGAPREAVDEIRRRVIDEAAPFGTVSRQYRDVVFPVDEDTQLARDSAGVKNVAKRLRELLAGTHAVPRRLATEVSGALDRLLEAIEEKEEAAA